MTPRPMARRVDIHAALGTLAHLRADGPAGLREAAAHFAQSLESLEVPGALARATTPLATLLAKVDSAAGGPDIFTPPCLLCMENQ